MEPSSASPTPASDPLHTELTKGDNKRFLFVMGGLSILLLLIVFAMATFLKGKLLPSLSTNPNSTTSGNSSQNTLGQWINCNDVRDIISEGDTLYVGCYGGVLILNKNGQIQEQITKTSGLGNHTTTSLVKMGDTLYVGSQDGFTQYHLKTKEAKKISVNEGLVNGSNIVLKEDGTDIWVGTFDGLSKYSTTTGVITNYRTELANKSTKYNISNILVTPSSVYVIVLASAESSGGVARLDKQTQTWEKFDETSFVSSTSNPSRVDLYKFAQIGEKVYAADSGTMIWETENKKGGSWKKMSEVMTKIIDSPQKYANLLGSQGEKLYIQQDKQIFAVTPSSNSVEAFMTLSPNTFGGISPIIFKENKMWYIQPYSEWIGIDIPSKNESKLSLERPSKFSSLLGVIDTDLFLVADASVYSLNKNQFKKVLDLSNGTFDVVPTFYPIVDSDKIFMSFQSCGQACTEPLFYLYDYKAKKGNKLTIPDAIQKQYLETNQFGAQYPPIVFHSFHKEKNTIVLDITGNKAFTLSYSLQNNTWDIQSTTPTVYPLIDRITCIPSFTYAKANKFEQITCLSEDISPFKIETGSQNEASLVKKEGGTVDYPLPSLDYSPFTGVDNSYFLSHVVPSKEKIWVVTSRGFSVYDKKSASWKALTEKDGILSNSNILTQLLVTDSEAWVLTEAGLSYLPQ